MSRDFVMIPGAWHGAWAWQPVAARLRAAGHGVQTVTLPGMDGNGAPASYRLEDAVRHIVGEVERREADRVVLVSHSWGAFPAAVAAHRVAGRLSGIVYVSGIVPTPGLSLIQDNPPESRAAMQSMLDASSDYSSAFPPVLVAQALVHEAAPEVQRLVGDLLVPQPGHYFSDPAELPSAIVPGVPAAYLLGDEDRLLPHPGVELARRAGVEPVGVPGGHDAMLTHPDELAEALLRVTEAM